jgi:hypothetical protein
MTINKNILDFSRKVFCFSLKNATSVTENLYVSNLSSYQNIKNITIKLILLFCNQPTPGSEMKTLVKRHSKC